MSPARHAVMNALRPFAGTLLALALLAAPSVAFSAEKPAKAVKAPKKPKVNLGSLLGKHLVDADGKAVPAERLTKAKYVFVYYSAHWCGGCRAFTPELIKFYNEHKKGDNLEVVFASADKSEAEMYAYMKEAGMPFMTVRYDKRATTTQKLRSPSAFPHLVLFDQSGATVAETNYSGPQDTWMGCHKVMYGLKPLLQKAK